jgi:hypothetical protein
VQRGKHCSEFRGLLHEFQGEILLQEVEIVRKKNLVFQFSARAKCNANEVGGFRFAITSNALHDVGGYRNRCAAHLNDQAISFCRRETLRRAVNRDRKLMRFPPGLELPVVAHTKLRRSTIYLALHTWQFLTLSRPQVPDPFTDN